MESASGSGILAGAQRRATPENSLSEPKSDRVNDEPSPMNLAEELELMRRDWLSRENLDLEAETTIDCRSIRFGSYKFKKIYEIAIPYAVITELGFVLDAPSSSFPHEMKTIVIPRGAITKILGHTGEVLPVLVLKCTADYAKWVCGQLGLRGNNKDDLSHLYCPETGAPTQRDIIMVMYSGSESLKEMLTMTFPEVYQEVGVGAINKILIDALPQKESLSIPMIERNQEESDSSSEDEGPPPTAEKRLQKVKEKRRSPLPGCSWNKIESSSTTSSEGEEPTPTAEKRVRKVKEGKRSPVPRSSAKKIKRRDSSTSTTRGKNIRSRKRTRIQPVSASMKRPRAAAVKARRDIRARLMALELKKAGRKRRETLTKTSESVIVENSENEESDSSIDIDQEARMMDSSSGSEEGECETPAGEKAEEKDKEAQTEGNQNEKEIDKEMDEDKEKEESESSQRVIKQQQEDNMKSGNEESGTLSAGTLVAFYNSDNSRHMGIFEVIRRL